jgi:hypothetical protein
MSTPYADQPKVKYLQVDDGVYLISVESIEIGRVTRIDRSWGTEWRSRSTDDRTIIGWGDTRKSATANLLRNLKIEARA